MSSSPLRSPTGELPQSPTTLSPQSFHSPLHSPSHGPTSSDHHSTPPSPSLNNKNNTTDSFSRSPASGSLHSQIPRSPNNIQSQSRGTPSSGNHTNSPSSLLNNTTTNSPLRSPSNRPVSLSHLSIPHSPSNNNIQENYKESQSNSKRVSSPKLYPLHLRSSRPSIQIQPPSLNSLSESEPSPSPSSLAIIPNPINESSKRANFDEEAIDSPLRTANLDRSDGPGRITGRGGGGNTVVAEAVWRSEVRRAVLLLRVLAAVLCLVSFSVMAADRTKGWDGDSYQRYEEYRYVRLLLFCLNL